MNSYKEQALTDLLNHYASFMIQDYSSAEELDKAVESGNYDGGLYQDDENGKPKKLAQFNIEAGEGKVFFAEGSTWIVWYHDILNRWYRDNKDFLDKEVNIIINR